MNKIAVQNYINAVYEMFSSGEAREESYYSILEGFLNKMGELLKFRGLRIITMPKKTDAGNPDFVVKGPCSRLVGYVEAKAPFKNLDEIERSPQVIRYLEVFPNLLLTDFLEFRVYRQGNLKYSVSIDKGFLSNRPQKKQDDIDLSKLFELFKNYFSFNYPDNLNARDLARELAKRTRFMRDYVVMEELKSGGDGKGGEEVNHIRGFYNAFKTFLIHDLQEKDFADLYSQTLTFGLFTAAVKCQNQKQKKKFHREKALLYIPQANGILRSLFEFISIGNVPQQMRAIMDDIVHVMESVRIHAILNEYFQEKKGEDPVHHFYETFLSEYDPQVREKRGVYYTPRSIVSFIVRSIDIILKKQLNRLDGLADPDLKILDPAAGTSTFLAETAKLAINYYVGKYGEGTRLDFARKFLTKNLYGFEIMMAPYAVAYLKMAYILESMDEEQKEGERLNLYLTNALEMEEIEQSNLPGMSTLSRESLRAGEIKKKVPLHVIMGNPPYAGHSLTKSETVVTITTKNKRLRKFKVKTWIGEQIEQYKQIEGKQIKEKNFKWLQDDYVKFLRFAQVKVQENGEGIVGMVTNHAYLDNPTFRGMRYSLMKSFNEIYILNLHGGAMKKERAPGGGKDENVFDIRQGVAISLFIKKKDGGDSCNVYYTDLWGHRDDKYEYLGRNDIETIQWKQIFPKPDFFLFIPGPLSEEKGIRKNRYQYFFKVTDIFPVYSVGIVTARDNLTVKKSEEEVYDTVVNFANLDETNARSVFKLGKDSRDWQVEAAQKDVLESGIKRDRIVPILYRPFDTRYTYYTGNSRGFHCMPRPKVMGHMLQENIGLITVRQVAEEEFNHCFVTDSIADSRVTTSNKGIAYLFPLYLYQFPARIQTGLFNPVEVTASKARKSNINSKIFYLFKESRFNPMPTPEQIFHYIYAVMNSRIYREIYIEYLKIDFPRIPFVSDSEIFWEMERLGEGLVSAHLLKSPQIEHTFSKFVKKGDNRIERICYKTHEMEGGRVYINKKQFFSNIEPKIWKYNICGYQILDKWLKSRKIRKNFSIPTISHEDMVQFIKIARAIELTVEYQEAIDRLFPRVEKNLIESNIK